MRRVTQLEKEADARLSLKRVARARSGTVHTIVIKPDGTADAPQGRRRTLLGGAGVPTKMTGGAALTVIKRLCLSVEYNDAQN
jgi:hypothetical protein